MRRTLKTILVTPVKRKAGPIGCKYRPIESVMNNDNVDTSTLSDGKETINQSELTGLTKCGVYSSTTEARGSVNRLVNESVTAWNGH